MAGQPYMSRPFGDLESVQDVLGAGAGNGHEGYLASVGRIVRWHRPSFTPPANAGAPKAVYHLPYGDSSQAVAIVPHHDARLAEYQHYRVFGQVWSIRIIRDERSE
jgi:hypothetical protein